jgi:hypothetical protein
MALPSLVRLLLISLISLPVIVESFHASSFKSSCPAVTPLFHGGSSSETVLSVSLRSQRLRRQAD